MESHGQKELIEDPSATDLKGLAGLQRKKAALEIKRSMKRGKQRIDVLSIELHPYFTRIAELHNIPPFDFSFCSL
jgi:hypothetical protein